jgi:hypothetical protein
MTDDLAPRQRSCRNVADTIASVDTTEAPNRQAARAGTHLTSNDHHANSSLIHPPYAPDPPLSAHMRYFGSGVRQRILPVMR